jgi:hypothetical protein
MNLVFGFLLHFDFWLYLTYVIHCKWVAGTDDPADSILCGSFTAQGRIIFELFFATYQWRPAATMTRKIA